MPELVNLTPFPNFRYYSADNHAREFGIVIVKATYEIGADGQLVVAEEQAPFVFTDLCHGAVNVSSLWHPSDVAPNKPGADVIVNAVARATGGALAPTWLCGIKIEGAVPVMKTLRVTGPREWRPVWRRDLGDDEKREWRRYRRDFEGWRLSEPAPIAELPVRYEYAYGGLLTRYDSEGREIVDANQYNPIGRGWIDPEWTDATVAQAAPQIERADDPIRDPFEPYAPQSLGPIPPAWLPRRPLGGTYDQNWIDNIWPNWAPDYSFAYHNSAHPELILGGYLNGDETVRLLGVCADREVVTFRLPGDAMFVDFVRGDDGVERRRMDLDTLLIEAAEPEVRDWRVMLSWRTNFEPGVFKQARNVWSAAPERGSQA